MTELKTSHRNYSDTYTRWYTCHQINEVVFCKKVSSTLRFFIGYKAGIVVTLVLISAKIAFPPDMKLTEGGSKLYPVLDYRAPMLQKIGFIVVEFGYSATRLQHFKLGDIFLENKRPTIHLYECH